MNAIARDETVKTSEHPKTSEEAGERGIWQFPGPWVEVRRGTVLATARVAAAPERVFRALFTAELEGWWGSPDTYRMTRWKSDLRVGGRWGVVIEFVGGPTVPAGGEFLEIDPPHRVVHTRAYEWNHPTLGRRETKVTCLLAPVNGGTGVTVRHEGFAGFDEAARQHAEGWERVLRWLAAYFESDGSPIND
jgi:uncharacterized protein YndB with AHSA1/START domain